MRNMVFNKNNCILKIIKKETSKWSFFISFMVGIVGFEPTIADSESAALPLGDIPEILNYTL